MYRFTPPTTTYRVSRDDLLWTRVKNDRGMAVVQYDDGRITAVTQAPSAGDAGVTAVWPGGRTYDITDAQATTLTEAGYGSYLQEIL